MPRPPMTMQVLEKQLGISPLRNHLSVLVLYNLDPAWTSAEIDEARQLAHTLCFSLQEVGHPVVEVCLQDQDLVGLLQPYNPGEWVVFNACEEIPGIFHTYDLIAQILENLGFTFTGADSSALSFSQDKRLVKEALDAAGIRTPRWAIFPGFNITDWSIYPTIVKPALEHCSIGLTPGCVVSSPGQLAQRVDYITTTFQGPALVEEFIQGREFTVNMLGTDHLVILPIAEMDFSALANPLEHLLTYQSKFDPNSREYNLIKMRLPAVMTPSENCRLIQAARRVYRLARCRDFARLDFRMRDGTCYILDINPNPDMSPCSSAALSAEHVGLSYGMLTSLLVNLAACRHPIFGRVVNPVPGNKSARIADIMEKPLWVTS